MHEVKSDFAPFRSEKSLWTEKSIHAQTNRGQPLLVFILFEQITLLFEQALPAVCPYLCTITENKKSIMKISIKFIIFKYEQK